MSPTSNFDLFKTALARQLEAEWEGEEGGEEVVAYLASEAWSVLPEELKTVSPPSSGGKADAAPEPETTPGFVETLGEEGAQAFLRRTIADYLAPSPRKRKTCTPTECEICEREVPLTFHHLVPRATHAKARKRGWHTEEVLGSGAWLCRYARWVSL